MMYQRPLSKRRLFAVSVLSLLILSGYANEKVRDVRIREISVRPPVPKAGTALVATAGIETSAEGKENPFYVDFIIYKNGRKVREMLNIPVLPQSPLYEGGVAFVSGTAGKLKAGEYEIEVKADATNAIPEKNETNNIKKAKFIVLP